jgi:transposase
MPISADTLLRLIRAAPVPVTTAPRVIGIDDWAWRRGQRYGTLIVDLERNRPVDLLPDRDARTVEAWLQSHPGIEIVARDRAGAYAGAYAGGIRSGAPEAVQVGDRWHLLRNLGDALARALDRHQHDLRAATASVVEALQSMQAEPEVPLASPAVSPAPDRHAIRRARFDEALALHGQGWPVRRIARALGVNRQTVQGWLRSRQLPMWRQQPRGSTVDRHADHLRRRWDEGCRDAAELWREIRQQGFRGQLRTVQRWVRQCRSPDPTAPGLGRTTGAWRTPSRRRVAWLVVADRERLDAREQRFVDALMASAPELGHLISLAREFRTLVRDLAAVRAALSLPWSTGPVEGQISRLKTIKRTMCGRAGFELLRHRVLEAA